MARWIRFLLAILIGAAGGLFYGWALSPVEYVDTTPDSLRVDYKTDYVLMVAEAYAVEADLSVAARRLALLGSQPPDEIVYEAVLFAERQGYVDADLALMRSLYSALQTFVPGVETPVP